MGFQVPLQTVLLLFVQPVTGAQGICVQDPLTVGSPSGRVVSRIQAGEIAISGARVDLLRDRYPRGLLLETSTDEQGHFRFAKAVKPGKYVLKVTYPDLSTFYGGITVVKGESRTAHREMIIRLGADFTKPCGGSSAELTDKAP
jgi:hypothetical protein